MRIPINPLQISTDGFKINHKLIPSGKMFSAMIQKTISIFIFLISWLLLHSCTSWKYVSKNNTVEGFRLNGKPQKMILFKYQQGGELFSKTTFHFNQAGQLTRKQAEIHNPRTEVQYSTSEWVYDENGFLLTN